MWKIRRIIAGGLCAAALLGAIYFPASRWWENRQDAQRMAAQEARAVEASFHSDVEVAETMRRGDQIMEALQAFRAAHGRYPGQLEELCPQFLAEIPLPTAGERRWKYSVLLSGDVELIFGLGHDFYPCYYKSNIHNNWHVDS
jgi:hypothetical protein